jgi:hypothetical protein
MNSMSFLHENEKMCVEFDAVNLICANIIGLYIGTLIKLFRE